MPYCPTCRTEYQNQQQTCDTCNSSLVDILPPVNADEELELVELTEFSNVSEAEMIREILEQNNIQTVQRGEVDPIGIASGAEPIALFVEKKHFARARELYEVYFAGSDTEATQPGEE